MLHLPQNIRLIRLLSGKTQPEFGKKFNATKAMIVSYEKGKANPDELFLSRISRFAGVQPNDLLNKSLKEADIKIKEEKVEKVDEHTLNSVLSEPQPKYMSYSDQAIYNLTESNRMLSESTHKMVDAILHKVALLDEIKSSLDKIPDSMGLLTDLALKGQEQITAKLSEQFVDLKKQLLSFVQPVESKKTLKNQKH